MSTHKHPQDMEQIVTSLDNIGRAEPSERFEERLFQRIEQLSLSSHAPSFVNWFKWSVAAMILMAMINGFVALRQETTIQNEALTELWQTDDMFSSSDLFLESNDQLIEP